MKTWELRVLRRKMGWSQMLLARYLGVDRTTICNWEAVDNKELPRLAAKAMDDTKDIQDFSSRLTNKERMMIARRAEKSRRVKDDGKRRAAGK